MELIRIGSLTNNYLYPTKNGYVLVDTGYPEDYGAFCKALQKNNIKLGDIAWLFLTHAHDDHAGFINELLRNSNAKVILHPKAIETLQRGQNPFVGGFSSGVARFIFKTLLAGKSEHRFPPIEPEFLDRCIAVSEENKEGLERDLGGRIILTPGHTECSITLLLDGGILICGDAAMNGAPSARRATVWIGDLDRYCRSWEDIIALGAVRVYPGHGKPFPVADLERYLPEVRKLKILTT